MIIDLLKYSVSAGRLLIIFILTFSCLKVESQQKDELKKYLGIGTFIHHRYFDYYGIDYFTIYIANPDDNNPNYGFYNSLFYGIETEKWVYQFGLSRFINNLKYQNESVEDYTQVHHGPTDGQSRTYNHYFTDFHVRIMGFSFSFNLCKRFVLFQNSNFDLEWNPGLVLGFDFKTRHQVLRDEVIDNFSGGFWSEDTSYNYTPRTNSYTSIEYFQFNDLNLFYSLESRLRMNRKRISLYFDAGASFYAGEFFISDKLSQHRKSFYYGIGINYFLHHK